MRTLIAVSVTVLFTTSALARPAPGIGSYEDLFKEADVVAIVKVKTIADTTVRLEGYGDPNQYQGRRAEVVVKLALKGELKRSLSFDFFVYASGKEASGAPDGAEFANLGKADKVHYLVFLKKAADGTLVPVSGHYDADLSIREVAPHQLQRKDDPTTRSVAALLVGCATSLPDDTKRCQPYQQVHLGMNRLEVYQLLGQPNAGVGLGFRDSAIESWSDTPVKGDCLILSFGVDGRVFTIDHKRGGSR